MNHKESDKELERNKKYQKYIENITPKKNLPLQMTKAFFTGGGICVVGQVIIEICKTMDMDVKTASTWCSLILVFISIVLTGFNIYPSITKFGGAGALVPITGFANSVAAPAIEYKKEGQVFGIGCKIFTISGPVILYGVFTSWFLGLLYWLFL